MTPPSSHGGFNSIDGPTAPKFNLASPLFQHARQNGKLLALSVDGRSVSYGELAALAQRVARWLTGRPSRPPGFVCILASRSVEAYAGILGTCWAGDTYVPLNPKLPEARLAQLLSMIKPVALVVDDGGLSALTGLALSAAPNRMLTGFGELPPHDPEDRPRPMQAGDIAYMIFTSGSTGLPKGVMIPARAVTCFLNVLSGLYGFRPEDRFSMAHNETFDVSVHDMFSAWNVGASVHVVPATQRMGPLKFIQERQLTVWGSVPSTAVFLERMNMLKPGAFPTLRHTIFAGEPLPLRSAQAWQQAAPNSSVDNLYGPTECTIFSTWERLSDTPHVTRERGTLAIGKPLPGFEAGVLDESCSFIAPGMEGELALSGPQVATGYFQDPERTAERFPVIGGKIWYRTGDLVFQDASGIYHHLGRLDNQVKILGNRVELEEVEKHLREVCGSDMVAAVPWPVEYGSAQGLVAFVSGTACSPSDVKKAMRSRVADYMVPGAIRVLKTLPLNANGKVDRRELERMLAEEQT